MGDSQLTRVGSLSQRTSPWRRRWAWWEGQWREGKSIPGVFLLQIAGALRKNGRWEPLSIVRRGWCLKFLIFMHLGDHTRLSAFLGAASGLWLSNVSTRQFCLQVFPGCGDLPGPHQEPARNARELIPPCSSYLHHPSTMTDVSWWTNTSASWPLGRENSKVCSIPSPRVP